MKIALIGYGKMGHAIEEAALSRGHEIVCRIDKDNQEDFDSVSFKSADVAIEFTAPSVAVDNYRRAFAAGVPVVSGTTGWLEHLPEIREACEKGQTFFYASNFSLGVNIFFAVNKYLAGIMNHFPQYSVEIEEIHHIHKLDHPSGTAITLAEDIIGQLDAKHSWSENMPVADDSIHITARREGEIPGTHTVAYDSAVDTIRITHEAKNRKGFALGAVVAAEFTVGKKGVLTMQEITYNRYESNDNQRQIQSGRTIETCEKNSLDTFLHRSFVIYRVDYLAKQLLCIVRPVATYRHLSHPIYSVGVVENQ